MRLKTKSAGEALKKLNAQKAANEAMKGKVHKAELRTKNLEDKGLDAFEPSQVGVRTPVNNIEYFHPNFKGLVLGCIDIDADSDILKF